MKKGLSLALTLCLVAEACPAYTDFHPAAGFSRTILTHFDTQAVSVAPATFTQPALDKAAAAQLSREVSGVRAGTQEAVLAGRNPAAWLDPSHAIRLGDLTQTDQRIFLDHLDTHSDEGRFFTQILKAAGSAQGDLWLTTIRSGILRRLADHKKEHNASPVMFASDHPELVGLHVPMAVFYVPRIGRQVIVVNRTWIRTMLHAEQTDYWKAIWTLLHLRHTLRHSFSNEPDEATRQAEEERVAAEDSEDWLKAAAFENSEHGTFESFLHHYPDATSQEVNIPAVYGPEGLYVRIHREYQDHVRRRKEQIQEVLGAGITPDHFAVTPQTTPADWKPPVFDRVDSLENLPGMVDASLSPVSVMHFSAFSGQDEPVTRPYSNSMWDTRHPPLTEDEMFRIGIPNNARDVNWVNRVRSPNHSIWLRSWYRRIPPSPKGFYYYSSDNWQSERGTLSLSLKRQLMGFHESWLVIDATALALRARVWTYDDDEAVHPSLEDRIIYNPKEELIAAELQALKAFLLASRMRLDRIIFVRSATHMPNGVEQANHILDLAQRIFGDYPYIAREKRPIEKALNPAAKIGKGERRERGRPGKFRSLEGVLDGLVSFIKSGELAIKDGHRIPLSKLFALSQPLWRKALRLKVLAPRTGEIYPKYLAQISA